MPTWRPPRATEIDRKMREDFARRLKDGYGITAESADPILAVLFRTFAVQIEDIYKEAGDVIPVAMLDELMTNLGMPRRRSRPAQLVLRFSLPAGQELFESGTELIGETGQGERMVFALDSDIQISTARLVFAGSYQDGQLRLLSGVDFPEDFEKAKPSLDPVAAPLGPLNALYLAIDLPEGSYLDRQGFYFELGPETVDLAGTLKNAIWCVLDNAGAVSGEGLLRPRQGRSGIRELHSFSEPQDATEGQIEGFYGGRTFSLPVFPAHKRYAVRIPQKMEEPIRRIYGKHTEALFSKPRAWIQIGLPGCRNLNNDIVRIALNCVTASNLEMLNETLYFDISGTSIPVNSKGGRPKRLVEPVSVIGESGTSYRIKSRVSADENEGSYRFYGDRIDISPAKSGSGIVDKHATIRLLVSDGSRANEVSAGSVKAFVSRAAPPGLMLTNLTASAGGTDGEPIEKARDRFAELLLSRGRVVTQADLEAVSRAFEPRISAVRIRPRLERTPQGLRRVHQVTAVVPREALVHVEEQSRVLQQELENHLRDRVLIDLDVRVAVGWV
jgi:hypothetical protein